MAPASEVPLVLAEVLVELVAPVAAELAAAAVLVEAAELALGVELVRDLAADLALAELALVAVAVLGQEAAQELELAAEAKHLESGSLRRHCFEAAVLAVVAPRLAGWVPGRARVALGLA